MSSPPELPPNLPAPNQLRQQPVVPPLVPHPPGDNRRVNADFLGQVVNSQHRGPSTYRIGFPETRRDQRVPGHTVSLFLKRVPSAQREVVDEEFVLVAVEMEADVGQFMHQAEPEIVDAVVAQRQANDRAAVLETQSRAVQMGARQMPLDHKRDAVFGQVRSCARRGPSS